MSKSILILTSHFSSEFSPNDTRICNDYAIEFSKMGYKVCVAHNKSIYPKLFYLIARRNINIIAFFLGSDAVDRFVRTEPFWFIEEGVNVLFMPIKKYIPRGKFFKSAIRTSAERIYAELIKKDFKPDFILGHFFNPNIFILHELFAYFPRSIGSMVFHEKFSNVTKVISLEQLRLLVNKIDHIGFRSTSLKLSYESVLIEKNSFVNYSGIPIDYCLRHLHPSNTSTLRTLGFVGQMIPRKHPDALFKAAQNTDVAFKIVYDGDGPLKSSLLNKAKGSSVEVQFKGYLAREKVLSVIDDFDLFIMISENEAFGLVYLEAMARGKIVVASRNEGIDGVIVDGFNGFLCEAGNSKELTLVLNNLCKLSKLELNQIRINALRTARSMSKENMAHRYINELI